MDSLLTSSYSKRAPITPPRRNPILQNEIIVPEIRSSKKPVRELEPSPEKKVGIGKGEFSEQGRRSFSLAYDEPEKTTFTKKMLCPEPYNVITHSMSKRAVFTPTPRNPIIQEEIPFTPPKVRPKMTQSSIFKTEQKRRPKAVILKLGLYYENMKSKIFTGEAEEFRSSVRAVPIKACEAGNLLSYKGFKIPEDSQTNKPNNNKINKKDTVQKATLTGLAKVYSARITKSQISLNNY